MKKALKEYLNDYHEYSKLLSASNRQLTFAGIAIIWIFRNSIGILPLIPFELLLPLTLFVLSLFFEIMQYLSGTLIWRWFFHSHEKAYRAKKLKNVDDIVAPNLYQKIITGFFYLKVVSTISAYIFLLLFFLPQLR